LRELELDTTYAVEVADVLVELAAEVDRRMLESKEAAI